METKQNFKSINKKRPKGLKVNGDSYKILIVDDSMFMVKQISQMLFSERFEIAGTAKNGIEGLKKYKELFPCIDLVIMGITMGRMNGVKAMQKIIEYDSDAKVIMISALGKQDLIKKSLLLGAKNFIVKPLDRAKVLERIISTLE